MFIESLRRNWPLLHSSYFLLLFVTSQWLSPKILFAALPLENLGKVQRCFELLHRDGLRHHICWILIWADLYKIDRLIIYDPLTYLGYLTSMCLVRLWYLWYLARWIALWLSQWTWNESCMILNVSTNPLNHKASFDASTAAIYSTSVVERAIVSCNFAFQLMTQSGTVNT